MNDSENAMHQHFAKWYTEVSVGDDGGRREARWESVTKLVSNVQLEDLEALLQLCFRGRIIPDAQTMSKLFEPFVESDPTFDIAQNERELRILAGASLVVLMENLSQSWGDEAALGVCTAGLCGQRTHDLPQDLVALAETAIRRRAEANRARPKVYSEPEALQIKVNVDQVTEKLEESFDSNAVAQALANLGTLVQSRVTTLTKRQASAMKSLEHFLDIQDEELEMLWWLMGEYSTSYGCSFAKVPAKARALVVAAELADMTKVLPGPAAIAALMARAGLSDKRKTGIVSVVNAVSETWLGEHVSVKYTSPLVTPLHEAVKRRLETGENEAWVAGWAAVAGLPGALEMSSLDIGMQFYRESLYAMEL